MAKSTKSQAITTGTSDSYTAEELADPLAALRARPVLGGELKSVGTDSSRSSESAATSSGKAKQPHQLPAPTTENPSNQTVADSGADSTGGAGQAGMGLPPSDEEIVKKAPANKKIAQVRSVDDDDDFKALS